MLTMFYWSLATLFILFILSIIVVYFQKGFTPFFFWLNLRRYTSKVSKISLMYTKYISNST